MNTTDNRGGTPGMEARLAAALRARAELVQESDLGPIDVLDLPGPFGRRVIAIAALTAVAASIVIAIAFQFAGRDEEHIQPTEEDTPISEHLADIDGDGTDDQVELKPTTDAGGEAQWVLRVTLRDGSVVETPAQVGSNPSWPIALDLDDDGASELWVESTSIEGHRLPAFFTLKDGTLRRLGSQRGLRLNDPGTRVGIKDRLLYSWRPSTDETLNKLRPFVNRYQVTLRDTKLSMSASALACPDDLASTEVPIVCTPDQIGLPSIERLPDLDGDGIGDDVRLVRSIDTILEATLSAGGTTATLTLEPNFVSIVDTNRDGREEMFLQQSGGETNVTAFFALITIDEGDQLFELEVGIPNHFGLGASAGAYQFVGTQGVFSSVPVQGNEFKGAQRFWRWTNTGQQFEATDLGIRCANLRYDPDTNEPFVTC